MSYPLAVGVAVLQPVRRRAAGVLVRFSRVDGPCVLPLRVEASQPDPVVPVSRLVQVVDARDADRFTGATVDTVHDLPGGHIPGARNLFFRDLFREDGTYRPIPELREAVAKAGIEPDRPITASCGSVPFATSHSVHFLVLFRFRSPQQRQWRYQAPSLASSLQPF